MTNNMSETEQKKDVNKQDPEISLESGPSLTTSNVVNQESLIDTSKKSLLSKGLFIAIGIVVIVAGVGAFFMFLNSNNSKISLNNNKSTNSNAPVIDNSVNESLCQKSYDDLLIANNFDFDKYCLNQNIRTGDYAGEAPQKKKNLVLIFDASGSMAAQIDGKKKIDIAKEAAWKFIDQVANEENFSLSIVVYGHKGSNSVSQKSISCAGIDEVYYLGDVDAELAKSKLNKFDATGWTPIAGSFQKAKEILSNKPDDENFILLVSDGKEMCGGDPVATMTALKNEGLNVKADVIGFDVGGADEEQLKAIAVAGGGDYFNVSNAIDLENAFSKHKEMLNKADFKIGRALEKVSDVSFVINNYNQCLVMLKKEEAVMMLDIHAKKLIGANCEKLAQQNYDNRMKSIKKQLDDIYEIDMATFNTSK